jgi:hypothetical protein
MAAPIKYQYSYGQEALNMKFASGGMYGDIYGDFNPYVQHRGDFRRINSAVKEYCAPSN